MSEAQLLLIPRTPNHRSIDRTFFITFIGLKCERDIFRTQKWTRIMFQKPTFESGVFYHWLKRF